MPKTGLIGQFDDVIEAMAGEAAAKERKMLESLCSRCESPIEVQLGLAMVRAFRNDQDELEVMVGDLGDINDRGSFYFDGLYIVPQMPVIGGAYRVDFMVVWQERGDSYGVAVECDGHAFHERTKEQAARDRQRDRDFTANGLCFLRFTGSEIYSDADGCALEVLSPIYREQQALILGAA